MRGSCRGIRLLGFDMGSVRDVSLLQVRGCCISSGTWMSIYTKWEIGGV